MFIPSNGPWIANLDTYDYKNFQEPEGQLARWLEQLQALRLSTEGARNTPMLMFHLLPRGSVHTTVLAAFMLGRVNAILANKNLNQSCRG